LDLPTNDGAGSTVPVKGLSVRRASSTINLPSGGSLMIAGLIQNDEFNDVDGTPGLKDIPILGSLFRSQEFIRNKSELVVMVKVFKVNPVNPVQRLSLPTDGFVPASDFDVYLLGRLHKKYSKAKTMKSLPRIHGPFGYVME
jgi:pilus assembly protein CpaC